MNLKIELDIKNPKTWKEICGGGIKTIISQHLEALKKDLEAYSQSTIESRWFSDDSSNCKKCVYDINNEYKNPSKLDKAILGDCACGISSISNIADGMHHDNCGCFIPGDDFIEQISFEEMKKLKDKINTSN